MHCMSAKNRLAEPDDRAKQPGMKPRRPGHEPKNHIVRPDGWLSKIAITCYGDRKFTLTPVISQ